MVPGNSIDIQFESHNTAWWVQRQVAKRCSIPRHTLCWITSQRTKTGSGSEKEGLRKLEHEDIRPVLSSVWVTTGRWAPEFLIKPNSTSEDCLHLDFWAPDSTGRSYAEPLPVIVWIHGAGFGSVIALPSVSNPLARTSQYRHYYYPRTYWFLIFN